MTVARTAAVGWWCGTRLAGWGNDAWSAIADAAGVQLYGSPGTQEKANPLVIPASRVNKLLSDEGIKMSVIMHELKMLDAFCLEPQMMHKTAEQLEKEKEVLEMTQLMEVLKQRAQQVIT